MPHFEETLYDNALLCRLYAHLWRATGSDMTCHVALETADFMVGELGTRQGGFASAPDADSAMPVEAGGPQRHQAVAAWNGLAIAALATSPAAVPPGLPSELPDISTPRPGPRSCAPLHGRVPASPGRGWGVREPGHATILV